MKMKKIVPLVLAACTILTGCNHGGTGGNSNLKNETIIAAEGMTYDELLAKAKEEVGNGTVSVYGNSSQLEKALKKFTEETGIKVNNTKEGDADIYNHLSTAFQSNTYIADMVLLQDGNMLQSEMLDPGYLLNFIPKEASGTIADDDTVPMAAVYLNKIFMYNNFNAEGTEHSLKNYITNVWQLAGTAADKGHIANPSFKTPTTENVNMNFLVMLTSDAYVAKLKTAYKNFYGKDYVEEKAYKNIGYKWVAEFLKNSQAHSSDGTACKDVAKAKGGTVALVNYNKIKDLKGDDVYGAENVNNLSFPSLELGDKKVDGFGGFCYKMYSMVAANAKYPYAACALVSYITSKAGFENAWGAKAGYYSTNNTTKIASNDKKIAWWKERLVVEDPEVVAANYEDVSMFVKQYEGK
jgi:hypothetical protein